MIKVAQHLESEAKRRSDASEVNAFGRSAFNRYYYATFWIVREALAKIDPNWKDLSHAGVPDLLTKSVYKRFSKQIDSGYKNGLFSHGECQSLKSVVSISVTSLSTLMQKAYAVRVQADYKPEIPLSKDKSGLHLGGVKSGDASSWPHQANTHSSSILNVANKLGIL